MQSQRVRQDYMVILAYVILQIVIWLKGGLWYGGDQGTLSFPYVPESNFINNLFYAISNFPFLSGPTISAPSIWFSGAFALFNALRFYYSEYLLLILLFFLGASYMYKIVTPYLRYRDNVITPLIVSIVYMTNWAFYFSDYNGLAGIVILTNVFLYSLFPPLIYYLKKAFEETKMLSKLRYYGILIILFCIIGGISNFANFGEIVGFLGILIVGLFIFNRSKINLINLFLIPIFFILANAYWLFITVPTVNSFLNDSSFLQLSYQFFVSNSRPFAYVFLGIFQVSKTLIPFLILTVPLILIPFILAYKDKNLLFWVILYLISATFASNLDSPFGEVYNYLFLHFKYFVDFRTPTVALFWIQGLILSIIIPVGLSYVINEFNRKKLTSLLFLLLAILAFFPSVYGQGLAIIHVPNYFIKTVSYINDEQGNFNVYAIPQSYLWTQTDWYYGVNLLPLFLNKPVFIGGGYDYANPALGYIYHLINDNLFTYNASNITFLRNLLFIINVKYSVIQGDVEGFVFESRYISNLENYTQLFSLASNFTPYYVYKVKVNSSLILGTNYNISNLTLKDLRYINLSQILHPIRYYEVNPSLYIIVNNTYKYVVFLYAYNPQFVVTNSTSHFQFIYANAYAVNSSYVEIVNKDYYVNYKIYFEIILTLIVGVIFIFVEKLIRRLSFSLL